MAKINTKYSYQSFKGRTFTDVDPAEFNDSEIIGSSFYQQGKPYTKVFPDGTKELTLTRCNLDNVEIQAEITVSGGTNKQILPQNDMEYWIVGKDSKPVEPRDKARFVALSLSVDPASIPKSPLAEPITMTNDPKIIEQREIEAAKADETWIKEKIAEDKAAGSVVP